MLGVMNIVEYFEKLPAKIEFDYFPEIKPGMKNVVVLGASERSDISRDLGAELAKRGIKVYGNGVHAHFRDSSGNEYRCEHVEADGKMIVSKDAGIIFRKQTHTGATILLCAGLHQFGTQAAAEVALSEEFLEKVRKKRFKQFVQFVMVDVVTQGKRAGLGIVGDSVRWRDLPLQDITHQR